MATDINDYNYFLPDKLIANCPASPRDSSRLLVYDTEKDEVYLDRFINLDKYLPKKSFLVLNNTKVLPARITLYKKNTGKVKILFLVNEIIKSKIRGFVDRKVNIGDTLYFDKDHCINTIKQDGAVFTFEFGFSKKELFALLEKKGTMPIPLYIKNSPLSEKELRKKYQTIFSKKQGSAAAPTASLHFTNRLFKKLEKKRIKKYFVTLHVGLGTFAPIDEKNIKEKKLYEEFYEVSPDIVQIIEGLRQLKYNLVAVGTTTVRTLESLVVCHPEFISGSNKEMLKPASTAKRGERVQHNIVSKTDLFIFPPYQFQMVDCLITNFHLPRSSLMMLVEAFLQFKESRKSLIDLYQIAIKNNFHFYSFGDVMLIK